MVQYIREPLPTYPVAGGLFFGVVVLASPRTWKVALEELLNLL